MPPVGDYVHPLTAYPRGTLWHLVHHYFEASSAVTLPLHIEENTLSEMDLRIAERLVNVFHHMRAYEIANVSPEKRPSGGVWEDMRHAFHGEVYTLLANRDISGFASYMLNAMRRPLTHGLGPGQQVFEAFADSHGEGQRTTLLLLVDRLVALAEAVGAVSYENPEQGTYGKNMQIPLEELLLSIEASIGADICRPPIMGNFGLRYKENVVDFRVPDDAYTAYRLKKLREEFKLANLCEIGGGLGGLALQAIRVGFQRYFIFDIPLINLVQGYFLMKVFGPDNVQMFGEDVEGRPLVILPYWEFFNRNNVFELVVNRDSFPEIPRDRAREYFCEIQNRRCTLLSINQEAEASAGSGGELQLNVNNILRNYQDMYCFFRTPYWIRKGYVEEVYRPRHW